MSAFQIVVWLCNLEVIRVFDVVCWFFLGGIGEGGTDRRKQ